MASTTEFRLGIGESRVRKFTRSRPISAIVELVWNGLDANATEIAVNLIRTATGAVESIEVVDNGHGMTIEEAKSSFEDVGETWKATRSYTRDNLRVLHGQEGEGRLYSFGAGERIRWETRAVDDGIVSKTRVTGNASQPTLWEISDEEVVDGDEEATTGTTVTISVPQGKNLGTLENLDSTVAYMLPRYAPYLFAYPGIRILIDGAELAPTEFIEATRDLPVESESYKEDDPQPHVQFIEWRGRVYEKKYGMFLAGPTGPATGGYGEKWGEAVVHFTPILRSLHFDNLDARSIHEAPMRHAELITAAEQTVRRHINDRRDEIAHHVVEQLIDEGIYPYDITSESPVDTVERQTFDLVVTVARGALPSGGDERKLSVQLIHSALEQNPSHLQELLRSSLTLTPAEEQHLIRLLKDTELSNIIAATTTVTDRLNLVGGLRKILADDLLRKEFREVDELHPLIARNLWLFGEEWTWSRTEIGLTSVLRAHLAEIGEEAVLENRLQSVRRPDGTTGRCDVVLFRGKGDEKATERLIVELKRPTVKVGRKELQQIISYARAIVEDPQFEGAKCTWTFILVTYEIDPEIYRDRRQGDRPVGLVDDQNEYKVWVRSWGEIFDEAERKLKFFREQLDYEATDERVTLHLQESYNDVIPKSLRTQQRGAPEEVHKKETGGDS